MRMFVVCLRIEEWIDVMRTDTWNNRGQGASPPRFAPKKVSEQGRLLNEYDADLMR